jgi:hypothetical protein
MLHFPSQCCEQEYEDCSDMYSHPATTAHVGAVNDSGLEQIRALVVGEGNVDQLAERDGPSNAERKGYDGVIRLVRVFDNFHLHVPIYRGIFVTDITTMEHGLVGVYILLDDVHPNFCTFDLAWSFITEDHPNDAMVLLFPFPFSIRLCVASMDHWTKAGELDMKLTDKLVPVYIRHCIWWEISIRPFMDLD